MANSRLLMKFNFSLIDRFPARPLLRRDRAGDIWMMVPIREPPGARRISLIPDGRKGRRFSATATPRQRRLTAGLRRTDLPPAIFAVHSMWTVWLACAT